MLKIGIILFVVHNKSRIYRNGGAIHLYSDGVCVTTNVIIGFVKDYFVLPGQEVGSC